MKRINGNKLKYLLLVFVVFLFPTSSKGQIHESREYILLFYSICLFLIVVYVGDAVYKKKVHKRFIVMSITLLYLLVASFNSLNILGGYIVPARFISIMMILAVLSFDPKIILPSKFVLLVNELVSIIIILWNLAIIINVESVKTFTINMYSQFNWFTTQSFIVRNKPVFTFGVYSYGALFYSMLSILWLYVMNVKKDITKNEKLRYNAYTLSFISFLMILNGSIAFLLGFTTLLFFIYKSFILKKKWGDAFLILTLSLVIVLFLDFDWKRIIVGTKANGFFVRYLSNWFGNNLLALRETALGIGYTVPSKYDLIYSDSGYVVLFTMGNILLPVVLYSSLYMSLKRNVRNDFVFIIFILLMLFELALPGLIYVKQILFIAFYFMTIQSINSEIKSKNN